MTRLCVQLRQIYASGDSMTVLKLLKELIDAVEDFEGHTATSEQVSYLTEKVEELEPVVAGHTEELGELQPVVESHTDELDTHNEEIEGLQGDMVINNAKHLYQHRIFIDFTFGEGGKIVAEGTIYNTKSDEYNRHNLPRMSLTGWCFDPNQERSVPVDSVMYRPPSTVPHISYADDDNGGASTDITVPTTATVTDILTQIF